MQLICNNSDPPLITFFPTNSYIVNQDVNFKIFLPRADTATREIFVNYGDQTSDYIELKSKICILNFILRSFNDQFHVKRSSAIR